VTSTPSSGDTARVTTLASPLDPPRPAPAVRAVPAVAAVCVALVVAGLASYAVRGASLQELVDAWVVQNAPVGLVSVTLFGLALRRRPRNAAAWAFFVGGVLASLHVAVTAVVFAGFDRAPELAGHARAGTVAIRELPPLLGWPLWAMASLWLPAAVLAIIGLLHFPDGRLPSARWRPARWILVGGLVVAEASWVWAYRPWSPHLVEFNFIPPDDRLANVLLAVGMPVLGLGALLTVASLVARLRAADRDERRRVRPVVIAASLFLTVMVVLYPWQAVWAVATIPAILLLLAAIAASVTRHRLFDVEFVVSRAVTVAVLGGMVTLTYIGIVAGIGALVGDESRLVLSVAATAVVAVAFEPLRRRTLRLATRLVVGTGTTPEETLAELSDQFARADSTAEVLERVVDLLVASTGAIRAEVRIRQPDGDARLDAAAGDPTGAVAHRVAPIVHAGETLGDVRLLAARDERFLPADERLLRRVAAALGPVARNVRLTSELHDHIDELRTSRQRIVTAHDDARRSLERDIHDGAQQQLLSLRLKLGLAATLAERDGARATAEVLADAAGDADGAIRRLRDLARGLYPPVLAEQGLPAALRAHARDVPLPVAIDADGVGRYDRHLESAVYFCCLEAMHNATRHAHASTLRVELTGGDGALVFAVSDDGTGFDRGAVDGGAGLANMTDRIEGIGGELEVASSPDGGTVVRGRVPTGPVAAAPQAPVSDR
jgi:two-component system, NarL family, sensor kinase